MHRIIGITIRSTVFICIGAIKIYYYPLCWRWLTFARSLRSPTLPLISLSYCLKDISYFRQRALPPVSSLPAFISQDFVRCEAETLISDDYKQMGIINCYLNFSTPFEKCEIIGFGMARFNNLNFGWLFNVFEHFVLIRGKVSQSI